LLHLHMYVMADHYMIPEMEKYALKLFTAAIQFDTIDERFNCIEALEGLENLPKEKIDAII
jgi:hypothetical protein